MIPPSQDPTLPSLCKESSVCSTNPVKVLSNLERCYIAVPILFCECIKLSSSVTDDAEQHQYEEWLLHTQQLLQMQLKFLEEQIGVHRKSRKALCAKQRTAKKAGREFAEADAEKLKLVTEEQSKIQKQLDQVCRYQIYKLVHSKSTCHLVMQLHMFIIIILL